MTIELTTLKSKLHYEGVRLKLSALILFFLFLPFFASAQEKTPVSEIDAGVAAMNRHNPVRAVNYFRKALQFNEKDTIALEYLYAALLFSGDLAEARLLANTYSPAFGKQPGIPARRLITSAFIEAGTFFNSNYDSIKAFRPNAQLADLYLIPSYSYLSAGINLEPGARFTGSFSANIFSYQATQQFLIGNQIPRVFDVPYEQRAVYLSGSYYAGKGFHFLLAGQVISYNLPLYHWTHGNQGLEYDVDGYDYRDLALHASVIKRFPYVTVALAADANRLRSQWYKQAGMELTIYPAGNVNTYLKLGGTWLSDTVKISGKHVVHITAGRKLFGKVWIEGDYYLGETRNFSEQNAYSVFDNLDVIRKRSGVTLIACRLFPHLDFSLRYQYSLRVASWQTYYNYVYFEDQEKTYPAHSFTGGIIWRF